MLKLDVKISDLSQMIILIIFVALASLIAGCSRGASTETCTEFNETIDRNIVDIAVSESQGDNSDKSAIQQAARLAQNGNRLMTIMINVQLLEQNKCSPRSKSIDASNYTSQASKCYLARLRQSNAFYGSDTEKQKSTIQEAKSSCDFKSWNANPSN